jgi:opacity protein-like surface antigen
MKILHGFGDMWRGKLALRPGCKAIFPTVLLAVFLTMARPASAQAVQSADAEGFTLSAGGTASGYYLQYGEVKIFGATGFVDLGSRRGLGIEGEARWLMFHLTNNNATNDIHATTYAIGPRYSLRFIGRFQPYAKALVGIGKFNFPYNDGHDTTLVIAPGGGVDYRINRRIRLRLADVEYQYWPQFAYSKTSSTAMSSFGVSSGIRVSIF